MKKPIPIACTLQPGAEVQGALERYRELFSSALIRSERTETGVRWILRGGEETEQRARSLADMERRCCAFLDMTITATADALVWDVTGSEDATAFLDEYMKLAALASPAVDHQ